MKLQFTLMLMILVGVSHTLKAQQLEPLKILPFDSDKYEKMLKDHKLLDTLTFNENTPSKNTNNPYTMRIKEVPQNNMAKMPNMEIRKDIHYHMQIKKYDNCNDPKSPELEFKLLPDQKDSKQKNYPGI